MLTQSQLLARFAARLMPDGMGEPWQLQFAAASRMLTLARDERARLDQSCDQLVFLSRGATKLVAHASHDREQIVAFHFANDIVCVPGRAHHLYALVALQETELAAFSFDKVIDLAAREPAILRSLLLATRTSLGRCREKAIVLRSKSAPERLASFLVAMAERLGQAGGAGGLLPLPMSRRDIADSLGITIETVSRQLTVLRTRQVIETAGRSHIRILDWPALVAGAGFEAGSPGAF